MNFLKIFQNAECLFIMVPLIYNNQTTKKIKVNGHQRALSIFNENWDHSLWRGAFNIKATELKFSVDVDLLKAFL